MSQKPDRKKRTPPSFKVGMLDSSMVIRLAIASAIFAIALIINMPDFLRIILLVLSAAVAGYDIITKVPNCIEAGDYFATPVVVVLIAALAYFVGFAVEGAALLILYQIGLLLIAYAEDRTRKTALELLQYQDGVLAEKMEQTIKSSGSMNTYIESTMRSSSGLILKFAMAFAVIYAIALPLITNYSYLISIHRALTIILVATPMSVGVSIPVAAAVAMCYSAQQGVVFNDAASLEALADTKIAIFDKGGIFAEGCPKVLAMKSDLLDSNTFMNFVAHSVYYSDQPIAKAIAAINDQEYHLDLISDFRDIPGYGVSLSIEKMKVVFATREFFESRGVELPKEKRSVGQAYYMVVAGRYVGKVVISSEVNSQTANLVPEMKSVGIQRCILLTEESKESTQQLAEMMSFSEMYAGCDTDKKLLLIKEITKKARSAVMFVYANGIGAHSAATLDLRVSKKSKYADALVDPTSINNIPFAKMVSVRMREIAIENAIFTFVIKALLIFLSIIGYCNLWFAIFIDMVGAVVAIMNSIRVTNESLLNSLKYKIGK